MDEGFGGLIVIALIIGVIYFIVTVVIPLILSAAAIVLVGFGIVGTIIGVVVAVKNFVEGVQMVIYIRKGLGNYKNETSEQLIDAKNNADCSAYVYEEHARKSYFLGACFSDSLKTVRFAMENNFATSPDFSKGDVWYSRVLFFVLALCQAIAMYVIGTIATAALSLAVIVLATVLMVVTYIVFFIVYGIETIRFKLKKISYRCPVCKHDYSIPVYECPVCRIQHTKLKPGEYGIFKRKCLCGTRLPLTVKAKGVKVVYHPDESRMVREKFKYTDARSFCPKCGAEHNAGVSRPMSIALIGGAAAGKTTFKVAFLNDFLGEELVKHDIDYEFPSDLMEREFTECQSYYKGRPIAATSTGVNNDILTFSFFLKNKKFKADRMVQIYDMPGEVFQSGNAKEGWNNFTFSEGAVFLLDPYTLTNVREQNEQELKNSSMGTSTMKMDELVDSLINTLRQVRVKKHNGKFAIPIALTINKADTVLLKQQVGEAAVKNLMDAYPEQFSDPYVAMDYICRCFLAKNEGENFIANLDNNFENVHFFSSSPMGFVPKNARTRFYPINVLPIMQWMMLKADKELALVWKPDVPVVDLTEEQRNLYRTHREYYENAVENKITY